MLRPCLSCGRPTNGTRCPEHPIDYGYSSPHWQAVRRARLSHDNHVCQLEREVAGDAYEDRDLVFANELGRPIYPSRITAAFLEHRKAAGITIGTFHTLRHTHTTLALSHGVPLHVVAARIGDDPATVLRTYAHLLPTSDAAASEQIAGLVSSPFAEAAQSRIATAVI